MVSVDMVSEVSGGATKEHSIQLRLTRLDAVPLHSNRSCMSPESRLKVSLLSVVFHVDHPPVLPTFHDASCFAPVFMAMVPLSGSLERFLIELLEGRLAKKLDALD